MSLEQKYFKLGLFVLGAGAILVTGIVLLGSASLFEKTYLGETYVDESVQGLDVGAPVMYRGVKIGELVKVDFVSTRYASRDGRIRLVMSIRQERTPHLAEGTTEERLRYLSDLGLRVRLATAGLTGGAYLEVDLLDPKLNPPPEIPWKPEYLYVPSVRSTGTRLRTAVESILDQLEKTHFNEISEKIITLLDSLERVSQRVDPALRDVQTLLKDADGLILDARRVIIQDCGRELSALLASTRAVIDQEIGPAVKSARAAADRLPGTMDKAEAVLDRIAATLQRVDRLLAEESGGVSEAVDNLRVATADLRELTGHVKRYPAQALVGEPPPKKAVAK